jgi:NSS family neurotransmitter:Na+ symporter
MTLPGAVVGINAFFEPDWSKLFDPKVWVAAYGQNFFSSSICFAIMITYASYLPKKSEITTNAIITSLANSSFELMAGFGIFGALGFLATQQGVGVDEVVSAGVGLAFVVLPTIFYQMGSLGGVFASLFFVSLLIAGLSSLISLIEAFVAPVIEKFEVPRQRVVTSVAIPVAVLSFVIATPGGLYLLDIIDHFVNDVGIVFAGLVEVVLLAWVTKSIKEYREYADSVSDIKLGKWFDWSLSVITPVILGYMMIANLINEFRNPYEGYPADLLLLYGAGSIALLVVFAFVMPKVNRKEKEEKVNLVEKEANA